MVPANVLVPIVLAPLILWRMYARVRRHIGRQTSVLWRHWVAAVIFPLLVVIIGIQAAAQPYAIAALAGGAVVGIALAIWGLRLTRFEITPEGFFYTPNAHIGIALSVLLAARLLYRFVMLASMDGGHPAPTQSIVQSPLTLLIFGMLVAYYTAYAIGLLRWRLTQRGHRETPAP